jgi:D-alanyl-D-alanine carboxypeptidase (penicillin-binding protein 5/6)
VSWLLLFLSLPLPLPNITARSAILMDYASGRVIWAKNEQEKLPPASLTKILTAILILEKGNLEDVVTVGEKPSKVEPSALGLKPGDKITLRDLLTAILVRSANDAAIAAAEYISGSEDEFVSQMNERAKELGALNTHFVNCHGLPAPDHYSTALDIAVLARYALNNPIFASIVALKRAEIRIWNKEERKLTIESTNKFLSFYPYANGIKTGYTVEAGRCLAASAKKDGWQLIAVILNSKDIWKDAKTLFEYAFNNFQPYFVARSGAPISYLKTNGNPQEIPLIPLSDIIVFYPKNQKPDIEVEREIFKKHPPFKAGEKVGTLVVKVNREIWGQTDILAGEDASPTFSKILSSFSLKTALIALFLLILLKLWEERKGNNSLKFNNR